MAAADIFCQPNEKPEPFGLVFIEALYSAIPVVSTAIGGGASEIVDDTCGILTLANPGAVADAELALIRDPALRQRLGSAGKFRASALCDPETQINRIADVLENLSSHGHSGPISA